MADVLLIFNPKAGRGRASQYWPSVEAALRRARFDFDVEKTAFQGHAIEIAERAAASYKALVAVGGDGTAHEVVNGLLRASKGGQTIPFGIIPLGNGDDFVKMLPPVTAVGEQPYTWEEAIQKLINGHTESFDACLVRQIDSTDTAVQSRFFINGLNLGFSAHAGYNFGTLPRFLKGFTGYFAAVLKTLWKYPVLEIVLELDGKAAFPCTTSMAAVMNGRCFGRAFWVCPHADAQDGQLEIMVVKKVGRLTILQKIPLILRGAHLKDPVVDWYAARKLSIFSKHPLIVEADGEIPFQDVHHIQIETLPGVLTLFV